jgi:hypothetical protein
MSWDDKSGWNNSSGWGSSGWNSSSGWGASAWEEEQKKRNERWQRYQSSPGGGNPEEKLGFLSILSRIQNAYAWEKELLASLSRDEIREFAYSFRATEFWQWFRFAIKQGLAEVVMFILLIPLTLLIQLDIIKAFPQVNNRLVVSIASFVLLFSVNLAYTFLFLYLFRFVVGELTKRMVTPLVWGRAIPLFLKALILVGVSFFLTAEHLSPEVVYKLSTFLSHIATKGLTAQDIYYRIYEHLPEIQKDFLGSALMLTVFAAAPIAMLKMDKKVGFQAWLEGLRKIKCKLRLDRIKKKELHFGCGIKIYPEMPDLGVSVKKLIEPVYQTDAERNTHTDIIGTTGVGKTRLAESLVEQDIKMGNSVIVIDPKPDWDLFSRVWSAAVEAGRAEDFIFISLLHPHLSSGINPLKYYVYPDEVISAIVSTIQAKEEFFVNIAREMTTLIVQGLYYLYTQEVGRRKEFTYSEILTYISQDGLKKIANQLKAYKDRDPEKIEFLLENYQQAISSPTDYFNKVVSTLRTNVSNFAHGVVGSIVGKADDNKVIERLESGKRVICYVMTGSQVFQDKANQLSRVLLAMINNLAGRLNVSGMKLDPPLRIHIDEAYTALYHGIEHLFDKGRSTGIGLVLYHQSIGQFEEAVGRNLTKVILDNINTFFIMRVKKEETQMFAARQTGKKLAGLPTFSVEGHAGMFPNEDFRVPVESFEDLPPRVGVLIRTNAFNEDSSKVVHLLKTPEVKKPKIRVVPQDLRASADMEKEIVELLKKYV